MLDRKVIEAYKTLEPSKDCLEKILSYAEASETVKEKKKLPFILRKNSFVATAACFALIFIIGFTVITKQQPDTPHSGVYVNRTVKLTEEETTVTPETLYYCATENAVALYAEHKTTKSLTLDRSDSCIAFSIDVKNALISVDSGTLIVFNEQDSMLYEVGDVATVATPAKIYWKVPEGIVLGKLTVQTHSGQTEIILSKDSKTNQYTVKTEN